MSTSVSAPIAKSILEDAIVALDIKKSEGGLEKEYQWYDTKFYTIPDVVGLELKEAKSMLKNFRLEYSGSGSKIMSISPEAGTRIAENSTVRIFLSD